MIFINLLPDIKLEYARALRVKRLLVLMSAVLITCCIIVVSVLFFYAEIQQPRQIARIEGTASTVDGQTVYKPADSNLAILAEIEENKRVGQILTIQQQLNTLPGLREDRVAVDRLFQTASGDADERKKDLAFLDTLIPETSTVESANFDFENNTYTISGKTDTAHSANILYLTVQYIGIGEKCTPKNITSRIYPFRVHGDIEIPASSTLHHQDGELEKLAYQLSGIFSGDLFDPKVDAEDLQLVKPEGDLSNPSVVQPFANCVLPESDSVQLNPVSGNAPAEAAEDANQGEGNQEE